MSSSKIVFEPVYEVVIHYDHGVELGFFADILPDDQPNRRTYVRVEHGDPDAGHGVLTLDFKKMVASFGYDILYVSKPFVILDDKGDGVMAINAENIIITIEKKK